MLAYVSKMVDPSTAAATTLSAVSALSVLLFVWLAYHGNQFSDINRALDLIQRKFIPQSGRLNHASAPKASNKPKVSPPSEIAIREAEAVNTKNGHENEGSLSYDGGFIPTHPERAMPPAWAVWDEMAARLPELVRDQTLRKELDKMPLLDASEIPEKYLQRAASLVGIFAHSYIRLDGPTALRLKVDDHSDVIPAAVHVPWAQICKRMGRPCTTLTFMDLMLYNFKTEATDKTLITTENTKLMIPTADNIEEHLFYGVMIEMMARAIPTVQDIIEAQRNVLSDDTQGVKDALKRLTTQVRQIKKISLGKANAKTLDPVIWTKTVAILPIPWIEGMSGPSGTAHPFFHLIDEFIERHDYESRVGLEAIEIREKFPSNWQSFISAVRKTSVADYVQKQNDPELNRMWQGFKDLYLGDEGVLGFHRRKAYGFLVTSFRIGRNSTINGLGARNPRENLEDTNDALDGSRTERADGAAPAVQETEFSDNKDGKQVAVHEMIQHNNKNNGYWFSAGGQVYDATPYMSIHPGGEHVIETLAGLDATGELNIVSHLSLPAIKKVLDKYRIGTVQARHFATETIDKIYETLIGLAYQITETQNVYNKITSYLDGRTTSADRPNEITAFKNKSIFESTQQLRDTHAASLTSSLKTITDLVGGEKPVDVDGIVSGIKSEIKESQPADLTPESQLHLSRDTVLHNVDQNNKYMAEIKATTTHLLEKFEKLDTKTESVTDLMRTVISEEVEAMSRSAAHLGEDIPA